VLAICNTNGSTIPRESDAVIYTHAGPEIGVASTKGFITQVIAAYLLGLYLAQVKGTSYGEEVAGVVDELRDMPGHVQRILDNADDLMSRDDRQLRIAMPQHTAQIEIVVRARLLRGRWRFFLGRKGQGSALEFGDHFPMLLRQAFVQLLRQGFRFRSVGKLFVAGAAFVNHPASQVHNRVEKGMRRAAVLRLHVIHSFSDVHVRVEAEVHGAASLSCIRKVTRVSLN